MNNDFIFVYGTLRKALVSCVFEDFAKRCEYHADGYLQGLLYLVNGYPGAIASAQQSDKVYGEIYKIKDKHILHQIDAYEECTQQYPEPHEYQRAKHTISLANGQRIIAWVYLFNHDVQRLTLIKSGDYLKFIQQV